jgi:drug/metabolite transporter (DMT)-like permease
MATMADDRGGPVAVRAGLLLALLSATSFALSGALARGLIDVGWNPGAVVLARIAVGALVVAPLAARALRGRWGLLRRNARIVLLYGAVPVAGTQFAYFSAVAAMDVGPALLIEYTAPAAIVVWLWLRRGERPRALTLAGAGVAAIGLVLVLDLLSGADLALDGVLWALAAMLGAATYFVMSADTRSGVPPLALAGGGLAVGSIGLGALGIIGVLPMHATTAAPTYAGQAVPWWLPFFGLGVVTAAIAYTTGIAASRRLGSRLASFVALLEVVAAVIFAWLLLDQLPGILQLVGGAFIMAGVVVVKLGERPSRADVAARPAVRAPGLPVAAGETDYMRAPSRDPSENER